MKINSLENGGSSGSGNHITEEILDTTPCIEQITKSFGESCEIKKIDWHNGYVEFVFSSMKTIPKGTSFSNLGNEIYEIYPLYENTDKDIFAKILGINLFSTHFIQTPTMKNEESVGFFINMQTFEVGTQVKIEWQSRESGYELTWYLSSNEDLNKLNELLQSKDMSLFLIFSIKCIVA